MTKTTSSKPDQKTSPGGNEGPAPYDFDDDFLDDLSPDDQIGWVMDQQERMAAKQAVSRTKHQIDAQEKEQRDARHGLLEAVRATVPDVRSPLFEKLDTLAYEGQAFTKSEVVNILKAANVPLKDALDFYDLNVAQREDLLDRVGFYRGVIIDNRLSDPVENGFHDVLMRPDSPSVKGLSVANPLYRKPVYSGYFENFFTASEEIHQTQKSGVTNLDFSLSAAFGLLAQVGIGVGTASHKRDDKMEGSVGRMSYTTANFFLPKIELSFNAEVPCASAAFVAACAQAIAPEKAELSDQFARLTHVLSVYGHFVSKATLIGGRLFATEAKVFDGKESKSNLTDRFAAEVKFGLSSLKADVEAKLGYEKSSQTASVKKESSEQQSITFHGVGGEGTVVQNAAAWAESLYDYKRWAAIQRENLVPCLDILPMELSVQCWNVLKKYAATRTKQDLFAEGYSFLFYGKYGRDAGVLARDIVFSINNTEFNAAISLESLPVTQGGGITLAPPADDLRQMWRITESGQILSLAERQARVRGKQQKVAFAMTAMVDGGAQKDSYPVGLQQVGQSAYQTWEDTGSGEIINRALGNNYVLVAETPQKLVVRSRLPANRISRLWNIDEFSDEARSHLLPKEEWFKLRSADGTKVMSICGGETAGSLAMRTAYRVIAAPDIGGRHQLWRMTADGAITSALKARDNSQLHDVFLSVPADGTLVVAETFNPTANQRWRDVTNSGIALLSGKYATSFAAEKPVDNDASSGIGNAIELATDPAKSRPTWKRDFTEKHGPYFNIALTGSNGRYKDTPDGINVSPLIVDGVLSAIGLEVSDLGFWGNKSTIRYVLQLSVTVETGGEFTDKGFPKDEFVTGISPITDPGKLSVNQGYVYLPESKVYAICLFIDAKNIIGLRYQLRKDGPWIAASSTTNAKPLTKLPKQDWFVADAKVKRDKNKRICGFGLSCNPDGKYVGLELLQRSENSEYVIPKNS